MRPAGRLVDTAEVYSRGVSEEIIGRWFASRPAEVTQRVVLATKGRFPMAPEPNGAGLSRRHLTRALDESLRRLGMEHIDLYQVQPSIRGRLWRRPYGRWTTSSAGKISYWGLSNFTGWQLTRIIGVADALGATPPVTLQPQYSLSVREVEWEIVPAAQDAGLDLLPWSPLGGGYLSAKYRRGQQPTGDTLGSVTTPTAGWRPGHGGEPSGPGGSSTRCSRSQSSAG